MMRQTINLNKEKRLLFTIIKMTVINCDGIIYGGLVRDEIIATHHKSLFDNYEDEECEDNHDKYAKFWDKSYHPESKFRTLIPNDIDIYFKNNEISHAFITKIRNFVEEHKGTLYMRNGFLYTTNHQFIHKKITMIFKVGKTFCTSGFRISINMDVVINTNPEITIEPPFNNADFSCNVFIMSKIAENKYEIRLSKNTGTKLDTLSFVKKSQFQANILNDLIEGRTEFVRKNDLPDAEYINGLRILKMLTHYYNLKITNLLFREIEYQKTDNICDICQLSFDENEKQEPLIEILTNKYSTYQMHKSCFVQYLSNEITKRYVNTSTNCIECKCTRRNVFNFKNSYKYSSLF
jgi:hypothetical protein